MARIGKGPGSGGPHIPSAREISRAVRADPTRRAFGAREKTSIEAANLLEQVGDVPISPFQSLPTSASAGEFSQAQEMFGSRRDAGGRFQSVLDDYDAISMGQYNLSDNPNMADSGYNYANLAHDDRSFDEGPAPLSVVPTSTSNPKRPRTVAAGYAKNPDDPNDGKLSIVFRDGTFYNYYSVSREEWAKFKSQWSKGPWIKAFLDSKPRGPAEVSAENTAARQLLYRIAKTSQMMPRNGGGIKTAGRQINYQSQKPKARRF